MHENALILVECTGTDDFSRKLRLTVTKWLTRGGHLHTTSSSYGSSQGNSSFSVAHGTLSGEYMLTAKLVPDSSTMVTTALDFGSGTQAIKEKIRGTIP